MSPQLSQDGMREPSIHGAQDLPGERTDRVGIRGKDDVRLPWDKKQKELLGLIPFHLS